MNIQTLFAIVICALLNHDLSGTKSTNDDNWSRFRGPNGSGVTASGALPIEFGAEKNVIWKTVLPAGHSSPIVRSGKIYLTAVEDDDLLTICIEQETGNEIWRMEAPRDREEKLDYRNHPAAASPVVDDESVCVFFGDYGLLSYSLEGKLNWKLPLGPFDNIYGMGASPIFVGDLVILGCDQNTRSYVIGVDKRTGKQVWKTDRPNATSGHCSPVVYQPADGNPQIILPGSFHLTAYDATNGDKLWWVSGLAFEMKSTPVMFNDTVFVNGFGSPFNQPESEVKIDSFEKVVEIADKNDDGVLSLEEMPDELSRNFFPAIDLDGNGSLDSSEWDYFEAVLASKNSIMAINLGGKGDMTRQNLKWKYHRNIPQLPSPIACNDLLFMIDDRGIVTCFDPEIGTALKRGRLDGVSGNVYASPVAADNKLFFVTEAGLVAVTRCDDSLEVIAVNDLAEKCYATPAIVDDRIFIRTEKALYAFGLVDE